MEFCALASGSSGNCIYVGAGGSKLLVDAGISCKKIAEGLASLGIDPGGIQGILITHDHCDHIQGAAVFARKYGVPVYATPLTMEYICKKAVSPPGPQLQRFVDPDADFFVGSICLYTESIWGINIMKQVIVLLFSGATIPLAFFPDRLQSIAYRLPFQSIYNTPLRILLMQTVDLCEVSRMLLLQLFWCIMLTVLTSLFWRVSIRQITVNGG